MTAHELARSNVDGVHLRLLSPEDRPLALFGDRDSQSIERLIAAAGIEFVGAAFTELDDGGPMDGALSEMSPDYVVTLPLLRGPGIAGVPATHPHKFIPVDEYGRVRGLADVYAAGDAVDFPIKQGGLAAQQADTVAAHVAARYGAAVDPTPFRPVLRGMLFTGGESLYMRSGVPKRGPGRPRRVVSALVAADEDRRPLPCALPVCSHRRGGGSAARPSGSSTSTSRLPRSRCRADGSRARPRAWISVGNKPQRGTAPGGFLSPSRGLPLSAKPKRRSHRCRRPASSPERKLPAAAF